MNLREIASEFRLYLANYFFSGIPSHVLRLLFYRHVMRLQIGVGSNIFMGCWLDCANNLTIGKNTTINRRCRLDARGGITIGDNVSISSQVIILTADHDLDSADYTARVDAVVIGDNCFIGTSALIVKGVHLGKGAVVGAGSVVTRSIPAGEIWAGNPARKIRDRKLKEYSEATPYRRLFQ